MICTPNKKPDPFFSIITASYNSGLTIKETLESIKEQSFRNFEHIVVDGKSTDGTIITLKSYEENYDLTWISEFDNGISDALNKGLKRARGRYIIIIQADDKLLNQCVLENTYDLLKEEIYDIYSFPILVNLPEKGLFLHKPSPFYSWWYHFKSVFRHQGCFVHNRVYRGVGAFRTDFTIAMDTEFFYRALKSGIRVKLGNIPITLMGGGGVSRKREFIRKRIVEEYRAQDINETNFFWKILQLSFRILYIPYKFFLKT